MKRVLLLLFLFSSFVSQAQPALDWVDVASANGTSADYVTDVVVDAAGNTYACGVFTGTIEIGGNTHIAGATTQTFVVKYNSLGAVQWSISSTGDDKAIAHTIDIDDAGNVYVGGHHTQTTTTFGTLAISSIANEELFILKLTNNGNPIQLIGPDITTGGKSRVLGIFADGGDLYATGYYFNGNLVLGGNTIPSPTQNDVFITRMDSDLTTGTWLVQHLGARKEYGTCIAVNGNDVFVGGYSDNIAMTFQASPSNFTVPNYDKNAIWLIKCAKNNGNVNWAAHAGSGVQDCQVNDLVFNNGNVYITGFVADSTIFSASSSANGPWTYNDTIFSNGDNDIFVGKYNANNGNLLALWSEGGIGDDAGLGIAFDPTCANEIQICGTFNNTVNFGTTTPLTANGQDMFVSAYDVNGVFKYAFQESSAGNETAAAISSNNGITSFGGDFTAATTFTPPTSINNKGGLDYFVTSYQCANASTCGPTITCPPNDTVPAGAGCTALLGNYVGTETVVDGCSVGIASVVQSPIVGTTLPLGPNTVTLTVTDNNSNVSSCIFEVFVSAPLNPTIISCGTTLLNETTVGHGDNENNFGCVGFNTPGEDIYYEINVPAGNYWLQFNIDNVVDANDAWLETFWVGGSCPLGGGCLSFDFYDIATQQFSGGGNSVQYLAIGPGTYYFVVDAQVDGIDTFDIAFNCLTSGIEFDTSIVCGDPNNDGIVPYINLSPAPLTTQTCQTDTFCYDIYVANRQDAEWLDSVYIDLGSCYENVAPANFSGTYQPGNWVGAYDTPSNSISWQFNNTSVPAWGDGTGTEYGCDSAKTRMYNFCFVADISSTCASDSNLNIGVFIYDDAIAGSGSSVPGMDYVLVDDYILVNPSPTISCPGNQIVNNDAGLCGAQVNGIAPTASGDNCPNPFITYTLTGATTGSGANDASGNTLNVGVTTVQYMIEDSTGLKDSCQFTVTVNDVENPVISCKTDTVVNVDAGVCTATVNGLAPLGINDNCGIDSVSYRITGATIVSSGLNDASGTIFNIDTSIVHYEIVDTSGNIDTCSFKVIVQDKENPTITCPGNVSIACPGIVNAIAPLGIGDNCGIDSVSYVLTGATIGSGLNDASGTFFNYGVTTVTYTITDLSGNTASCNFTATVNDVINPTLTCPGNLNINTSINSCDTIINGIGLLASGDNCGVDSIKYVLTGATTGSGLNDASGTTFNQGVTTVTYTITDLSGNTASCSFTITVNDVTNPTITCPVNQNVSTDPGMCSSIVNNVAPTAFGDNCGVDSISYVLSGATTGSGLNDVSGTTFNLGVTTVTYTITDLSGNTTTCNFTVTVNDNEQPTITCPANVVTNNDPGDCDAEVFGLIPILNDNCGIDSLYHKLSGATVNIDDGNADGDDFNVGVTNVTYYVIDNNGNIDSCLFTVTVVDNEVPSISCPSNQNVNTDLGVCTAVVNNIGPTNISDNCSIDSVSFVLSGATTGNGLNDASGLTFNIGVTNVTYILYDVSGNVDSCSFTVTVTDNEPPAVNCPSNVMISNNFGVCTAVVTGIAPTLVSDNCIIDSVSYVITGATSGSGLNDASGTTFNNGVSTITYTVYDITGNSSNCQFTVTVTDTTAPFVNCPNNQVVSTDFGTCAAFVNGIAPIASGDNCGVDSLIYILTGATTGSGLNDASGLSFNVGVTTVSYLIYDLSGNIDSCTFSVTVNDNETPTITCPNNIVMNNDVGTCSAIVNGISPINVNDNCTIDSISYKITGASNGSGLNDASGTIFNIGLSQVTYYVYDNSGNMDSCTFTVKVNDTEIPLINCPSNIAICDTNVIVPIPTFSDNCFIDTIFNDFNGALDASGAYTFGITTVTWIVKDTSGNINTCSMTVEVEKPPTAYAGEDQKLYGVNSTNFNATGTGTWFNVSGFGNIANTNDPSSFVDNLALGENIFEWVVSGSLCPDASDDVMITYYPLSIPSGFSPNGDGDNDYFEIKGIELLENEVIIFNRWGVELYSSVNYQNNWDGRSDDGKDLPDDTYFYIIKIPGLNKELSGYIVLKR